MIIHCVIGPIFSGKSTTVDRYPPEWVRVYPGRVLRDLVGVEYMKKSSDPNCPSETNDIVKALVLSAVNYGSAASRPVVIDGFPRSLPQAAWIAGLCSEIGACPTLIVVDGTHWGGQRSYTEFDEMREESSREAVECVRAYLESGHEWPTVRGGDR